MPPRVPVPQPRSERDDSHGIGNAKIEHLAVGDEYTSAGLLEALN